MTNKLEISRELASVPRELLANFIEYSVPVAGHCSEWLREKEELRALLGAPVVERQEPVFYVLAKQTAVEVPGQERKELGYTLFDGIGVFHTREEVHAAIAELGLPIGWVSMTVDQLLPGYMMPLYAEQPAPVAVDKYDDVLLPFLALMRAELHANAHKGDRPGWLMMDRKTAVLEVFYHMGKLHQAVHRGEESAIKEYAADVANMCMMLLDVCACLDKVKELNQ